MKTALAGIPDLSAGLVCELYTIALKSGGHLYHNTSDVDFSYRGVSYLSGGPLIERGTITTKVGVEVTETQVTIHATEDDLIDGVPFPAYVNQGGFDHAWVTIERARQDRVVHLFAGIVTDSKADRTQSTLTVSSGLVLLNIDMPRNTFNPGCLYSVYDSGCGVSRAASAHATTAQADSTAVRVKSGLSQDEGYFSLGYVVFTSGGNAGVSRSVSHFKDGWFYLSHPLPNAPEAGDGFTAYPGCDGTKTTCANKFSNLARFRAFPYMPAPEASV